MNSRTTLIRIGMVALSLSVVGCKSTAREYCEKLVACEGGSDNDEDACTDAMNGEEDVAEDYNCGDQFDALLECRCDRSTCQLSNGGNTREFTSRNLTTGDEACQSQRIALDSCKSAASAKYYNNRSD